MAEMQVLTNMKRRIEKLVTEVQDVQKGMSRCKCFDSGKLLREVKATEHKPILT